jgi:oxygen-independent coproporphyrinogen III oxidase
MDIAMNVSMGNMDNRFYCCFARPDFSIAAKEMLHLHVPHAEPELMTEAQLQAWRRQPVNGDIVMLGEAYGEGGTICCSVQIYFVRDGILSDKQQKRSIDILPWENQMGAERRGIRLLVNELLEQILLLQASPWGILRGIRPTKLVHRLIDEGQSEQPIQDMLREEYGVYPAKAKLVTDIAVKQRPYLLAHEEVRRQVSIYVGIPFCPSRCLYCSFPAFPITGAGQRVHKFMDTLRQEIWAVQKFLTERNVSVQTVYVGGGTPTSLPDPLFAMLLHDVGEAFGRNRLQEYTVEAGRPDTISEQKLSLMRDHKVSRISINPQTMRTETLKTIGRSHLPEDVEAIFHMARRYGFQNINMDIIAGLPGETSADIAYTLRRIGALQPENLTVHTLSIKRGSRLKENADFQLPEASVVSRMLDLCSQTASAWGMKPYYLYRQKYMAGNLENVGYALPGKECVYNIQIMEERQIILGLGASAGTKAVCPGKWTLASCYNPKDVPTYISELDRHLKRKLSLVEQVLQDEEESLC